MGKLKNEAFIEITVSKEAEKIVIKRYYAKSANGVVKGNPERAEIDNYEDLKEKFAAIKAEVLKKDKRIKEEMTKGVILSTENFRLNFETEDLADEFLRSDIKDKEISNNEKHL